MPQAQGSVIPQWVIFLEPRCDPEDSGEGYRLGLSQTSSVLYRTRTGVQLGLWKPEFQEELQRGRAGERAERGPHCTGW